MWQSAVKAKLKIEVDGEPVESQPIVPNLPTHRVTGKSRLSALLYPQCPTVNLLPPADNSVEKLAAGMLNEQLFQCSHLSLLVAAMPARMFKTTSSETTFAGDSFFSGSYVRGNLVVVRNHARDYPNVTAYRTAFLKQRTSHPFASMHCGRM